MKLSCSHNQSSNAEVALLAQAGLASSLPHSSASWHVMCSIGFPVRPVGWQLQAPVQPARPRLLRPSGLVSNATAAVLTALE